MQADPSEIPVRDEVEPHGEYMTPVYDQAQLGSCTSNAAAAAIDASRIVDPFIPRGWRSTRTGIMADPDPDELTREGHEVLAGGYLKDHPHYIAWSAIPGAPGGAWTVTSSYLWVSVAARRRPDPRLPDDLPPPGHTPTPLDALAAGVIRRLRRRQSEASG